MVNNDPNARPLCAGMKRDRKRKLSHDENPKIALRNNTENDVRAMENTAASTATATTTDITTTTSNTTTVRIISALSPTQSSSPLGPLVAAQAHFNVTADKPKKPAVAIKMEASGPPKLLVRDGSIFYKHDSLPKEEENVQQQPRAMLTSNESNKLPDPIKKEYAPSPAETGNGSSSSCSNQGQIINKAQTPQHKSENNISISSSSSSNPSGEEASSSSPTVPLSPAEFFTESQKTMLENLLTHRRLLLERVGQCRSFTRKRLLKTAPAESQSEMSFQEEKALFTAVGGRSGSNNLNRRRSNAGIISTSSGGNSGGDVVDFLEGSGIVQNALQRKTSRRSLNKKAAATAVASTGTNSANLNVNPQSTATKAYVASTCWYHRGTSSTLCAESTVCDGTRCIRSFKTTRTSTDAKTSR